MGARTVGISREKAVSFYRDALVARFVDEKMSKMSRQNKGGAFHLYALGHELVGTVFGKTLRARSDWGLPYYRDRAFVIGLGCPLDELFGSFLAREVPHHSKGRMMPDHFSHKEFRIPCQSSCVGSQFLQAAGVALGIKRSGADEVVYVSGGDGSTSQGDFHEMLNFACLHSLPLLIVIQDNGWAISVPTEEQTTGKCCSRYGQGYAGLTTYTVDGTDIEKMTAIAEKGYEVAKSTGPVLVVAKIPRLGPHSSSDDPKKYKTESNTQEDAERDPIVKLEGYLLENDFLSPDALRSIREEIFSTVEEAAKAGEQYPHPHKETAQEHIFEPHVVEEKVEVSGEEIVLMDALNHGLAEAMEEDERILVFGQDVADGKGGVFGITRGLTNRFGSERCFNSPLAESTIIGVAIGLAQYGYRPVVEIQFCDYMWTGVNQLFNELASIHYRSGGEWSCPVVIRMPYGGYIQGGPYHSQSIEAHLCHVPGIKVVMPNKSGEAKMLLKAAIEDPNPVVFLEHKALYRQRVFSAEKEPSAMSRLPLSRTVIRSEGSDLTLITWSYLSSVSHEIVHTLNKEGISVEHIDLLTLNPLDFAPIEQSVKKTGKVLVLHEAAPTCGFGAELMAQITQNLFEYLDAPPQRITAKGCPIPYAKPLEDAVLPQKEEIIAALRHLARY